MDLQTAWRAATLWERLEAGGPASGPPPSTVRTRAHLEAWARVATKGDPDRFARRLDRDSLTADLVARAIEAPAPAVAPAWLDAFHEITGAGVAGIGAFVAYARSRVANALAEVAPVLTPTAVSDLEGHLEGRLRRIVAGVAPLDAPDLAARLDAYPVAARLLVRTTELWAEEVREFAGRLAADWEGVVRDLAPQSTRVVRLDGGLSDPHHGGRTVRILHLDAGARVVYKPRDLGAEELAERALGWVNEHVPEMAFRSARVVNRGTHGWVEFVEAAPCPDAEAVGRFYRRMGGLLALIHAFNGADFHSENVIAAGEHPVAIDLEGLISPELSLFDLGNAEVAEARDRIETSVVRTLVLPVYQRAPDGRYGNIGALRGSASTSGHVASLPTLGGMPVPVDAHVDDVVDGYARVYGALRANRAALLAEDSPFRAVRVHEGRFLLRNTSLYGKLLDIALTPRYLRDGVERSLLFDSLARVLLTLDVSDDVWGVLAMEREALEQGDIPIFQTRGHSRAIHGGDRAIADGFRRSPDAMVAAQLRRLSDDDLAFQSAAIRACLFADVRPAVGTASGRAACPEAAPEPWALAVRAGEHVRREARDTPQGGAIWYGMMLEGQPAPSFGMLAPTLQEGALGITLFLTALARSDARFAPVAERALRSLARRLAEAASPGPVGAGAGPGIGRAAAMLGPLAFALPLLDDRRAGYGLTARARGLAAQMSAADVAALPRTFLTGRAGLLAGLVALLDRADGAALRGTVRMVAAHVAHDAATTQAVAAPDADEALATALALLRYGRSAAASEAERPWTEGTAEALCRLATRAPRAPRATAANATVLAFAATEWGCPDARGALGALSEPAAVPTGPLARVEVALCAHGIAPPPQPLEPRGEGSVPLGLATGVAGTGYAALRWLAPHEHPCLLDLGAGAALGVAERIPST